MRGLGLGRGMKLGREPQKAVASYGIWDATVMGWLGQAYRASGCTDLLLIGDSNCLFGGTGFDRGIPLAARDAGFPIYAGPWHRLEIPGTFGWTPYGVVSASPFVTSGAPGAVEALYPGWGNDGFRQYPYAYFGSGGGSENIYTARQDDVWWKNGEPLKFRVHYARQTSGGDFDLYVQYDDSPFEEIDAAGRINVNASGAEALLIGERNVAEGAVAAGRPLRYAIMRGADRPTARQLIAGLRIARSGARGLASSSLWAAGGQSTRDLCDSLDGAPAGGLAAVLGRFKADQAAQGQASARLIITWQLGVNDFAEVVLSKDAVNLSNTKAGFKANTIYCMDALDAAAASAGVSLGHLLIGPHVRPLNTDGGDDQANDEERHILFRDALEEIAISRPRTGCVRLDRLVTGAAKTAASEYDVGSTAHQTGVGYRADGARIWQALGYGDDATGPVLSLAVTDNTVGSRASFRLSVNEWASVRIQVRLAASGAPSVADVIAGTGAVGTSPTGKARPWDAEVLEVTGLAGVTAYRAYAVGTDESGNNSALVAALDFTTPVQLWVPTDDANRTMTLDPNHDASVTMAGAEVSALADLYANGISLSRSTVGPGRLDAAGGSSGYRYLDFTTAQRLRTTGLTLGPVSTNPFSFFFIFAWRSGTTSFGRVVSTSIGATADSANLTAFIRDTLTTTFGAYRASAIRGDSTVAQDTYVLVQVTVRSVQIGVRINGGTETQETITDLGSALTYLGLGARADLADASVAATESLHGKIGPVHITASDPGTTLRQKIEGWLAWRAGLQGSVLPGGHPWLSEPPTF